MVMAYSADDGWCTQLGSLRSRPLLTRSLGYCYSRSAVNTRSASAGSSEDPGCGRGGGDRKGGGGAPVTDKHGEINTVFTHV